MLTVFPNQTRKMGLLKAAIGDALITTMRVTTTPFSKLITTTIAKSLGLKTLPLLPLLLISTITATLIITVFGSISNILGGASFNPSTTLAFHTANLTPTTTLLSIRFLAQSAGAVAGVKAILRIMPESMIRGPSLKVGVHTGFVAEGVLTFVFCFSLLVIVLKGPKSEFLRSYLVSLLSMGLVMVGGGYTGPSMNPANAFGWAYVENWYDNWELYYVYWVGPFIGAVMAAKVYAFLFSLPPPLMKEKKA